MRYSIQFTPNAQRDLGRLSPEISRRVELKIERLRDNLVGDVKRLRNFAPRYRLWVGDWRVLFEIEGQGDCIVVYHVSHRSEAYE
jgi:mRNA interferase RelE/StbE